MNPRFDPMRSKSYRDYAIGDTVVFTGSDIDQVRWGGNDNPDGILEVGKEYVVDDIEVHSSHTYVTLVGFELFAFNSVCFVKAGEEKDDYNYQI